MSLKAKINEDMKTALKSRESERLSAIRLLMAEIKQKEVDERESGQHADLSDEGIVAVIDKMLKQRRDAIVQYESAGRQDLADKEKFEMAVLAIYLPQPLSDEELGAMINRAITDTGAVSLRDMAAVMSAIKPQVIGRADMAYVSACIKSRLAS